MKLMLRTLKVVIMLMILDFLGRPIKKTHGILKKLKDLETEKALKMHKILVKLLVFYVISLLVDIVFKNVLFL